MITASTYGAKCPCAGLPPNSFEKYRMSSTVSVVIIYLICLLKFLIYSCSLGVMCRMKHKYRRKINTVGSEQLPVQRG